MRPTRSGMVVLVVLVSAALSGCGLTPDDPSATPSGRTAMSNAGVVSSTVELRGATVVPRGATATPADAAPRSTTDLSADATASDTASSPAVTTQIATGASVPGFPTPAARDGVQFPLAWTFRYASLWITLQGYDITDGGAIRGGGTCRETDPQVLAVYFSVQNDAPKAYSMPYWKMALVDRFSQLASSSGRMTYPDSGNSATIEMPANRMQEFVFCAGLRDGLDPSTVSLIVGELNEEQLRIPFRMDDEAAVGVYLVTPINQTFTYREVEVTLHEMVLTTGVWSSAGGYGQATIGRRWLMITTSARHNGTSTFWVDDAEIRLEVDGVMIGPSWTSEAEYQVVRSGLQPGLTSTGAMLFDIPAGARQATLRLVAPETYTGAHGQVELELRIPEER
jgi:hypothetical protein